MELSTRMQQKLEERAKKALEEILFIKINTLVMKMKKGYRMLIISADPKEAMVLCSTLPKDEELGRVISEATGLEWEVSNREIHLVGGCVVWQEEIDRDFLEMVYMWDGEEFEFEGRFKNGKQVTCSSFDPDCPCIVHSWEPDVRDFDFKRNHTS